MTITATAPMAPTSLARQPVRIYLRFHPTPKATVLLAQI